MSQPLEGTRRPVPALLIYYVLQALMTGPGLLVVLPYLFFRYHTLTYRFDTEGLSMAWGILFRREIHLTYARIQDIHLVSNVVERWLGLARIHIQTASAKAEAQMTLEGLLDVAAVRDHLYERMRQGSTPGGSAVAGAPQTLDPVWQELASELRAFRTALQKHRENHHD